MDDALRSRIEACFQDLMAVCVKHRIVLHGTFEIWPPEDEEPTTFFEGHGDPWWQFAASGRRCYLSGQGQRVEVRGS